MPPSHPHIWTYRAGTGLAGIIGLPFALMGGFFVYGGLTANEINGRAPTWDVRLYFCLFSSDFMLLGLAIMGGFRKVIVDKERKVITLKRGIFFPYSTKEQSYGECLSVDLKKEVRVVKSSKGGSQTYTIYPIHMHTDDLINISEDKKYHKARTRAESLAKYLECGMDDQALTQKSIREHHELDMPISERLKQAGHDLKNPQTPINLASKINIQYEHPGGRTFIQLGSPSQYKPMALWIALTIFAMLFSSVLLQTQLPSGDEPVFFELFENHFKFSYIIPLFLSLMVFKLILRGTKATSIKSALSC